MLTIAAGVCLGIVAAIYVLGWLAQHEERCAVRRVQRAIVAQWAAEEAQRAADERQAAWAADAQRRAVAGPPSSRKLRRIIDVTIVLVFALLIPFLASTIR
jgi:hypothetical protein